MAQRVPVVAQSVAAVAQSAAVVAQSAAVAVQSAAAVAMSAVLLIAALPFAKGARDVVLLIAASLIAEKAGAKRDFDPVATAARFDLAVRPGPAVRFALAWLVARACHRWVRPDAPSVAQVDRRPELGDLLAVEWAALVDQ